jgi:subtilisin family serine protease
MAAAKAEKESRQPKTDPGEEKKLHDQYAQKVHPRLRMIYNGDEIVNGRRAIRSAVVTTTTSHRAHDTGYKRLPDWEAPAEGIRISTFVEFDSASASISPQGGTVIGRDKLATAEFSLTQLLRIAQDPDVAYISSGEVLNAPNPITEPGAVEGPTDRQIEGYDPPPPGKVLIGIIDVGGFDFAHPDFLVNRKTRFERIWDQALEPIDDSKKVLYGRELTKADLDDAIAAEKEFGLPATELLRQSVQLTGSHATHVASIAGGNSGVCPTATLAGVSVAIPTDEIDGRRTFFDSVRLAHAVDYLVELGKEMDLPVVINISLGTNGHAHDGTSPINRWIESALDQPGRCVVVAAGNAGQDEPRLEGDLGVLSGRIHSSGKLDASGLAVDLEWEVLGNGLEDASENEMEIWYEAQDLFSVMVKPPTSSKWIGPVQPGQYLQNQLLKSNTLVSVYNERYQPANGSNRISVFLSPRLREPLVGVEAGKWLVRLTGLDIRDGTYHAWIERDDMRPVRRTGDTAWGLPSFFTKTSNVDNSSVNSLACGPRVLAVANYDAASEQIHVTSSQGPTRDKREKPEIAAPGTAISAANGFGRPDQTWVAKTGTSMASPYATGVVARMLASDRRLTAAQVIGMMRRTAQPLPGGTYHWQDAAGFGQIQPGKCLKEVGNAFEEKDMEG